MLYSLNFKIPWILKYIVILIAAFLEEKEIVPHKIHRAPRCIRITKSTSVEGGGDNTCHLEGKRTEKEEDTYNVKSCSFSLIQLIIMFMCTFFLVFQFLCIMWYL